jgi:glutathione S-transferase
MSNDLALYLGNKAYSSWSLRAWLVLEHAGASFTETVIPLDPPGHATGAIRAHSPSGKVPALRQGDDFVLWDSLAIAEYVAEEFPKARLWPEDRRARAVARAASAEMHSSFPNLRGAMPMNVRREPIVMKVSPEVQADVTRIVALWTDCRERFGERGPFLFGHYTIADAMFAPVATRFRTYGVVPDAPAARAYVDAIYADPAMVKWIAAAKKETWRIDAYESVS